MLASAGGLLVDPRIHEVGLACAIGLGALGLGRGIFDHGFMMPSSIGGIGLGTMAASLTFPHGAEEVLSRSSACSSSPSATTSTAAP